MVYCKRTSEKCVLLCRLRCFLIAVQLRTALSKAPRLLALHHFSKVPIKLALTPKVACMKKILFFYVVLSLLFVTGCSQKVSVDLSNEEKARLEGVIDEFSDKIKNFDPENPTPGDQQAVEQKEEPATVVIEEDGTSRSVEGNVEIEPSSEIDIRPPFAYFVQIALAQEELGRLSDALKTYKKALRLYENSQLAWHNMGRIYETLGKYDKAVFYYQRIIDQFGFVRYYVDISNAYIRKGDIDLALKAYNEYRLKTNQTDLGIETLIRQLREKLNP